MSSVWKERQYGKDVLCVLLVEIKKEWGQKLQKIENTLRENAKVETKYEQSVDARSKGVELTVDDRTNEEYMNTDVPID